MADFDPQFATDLLEANQGNFGGTPEEWEVYLKEAKARLEGRSPEDRREASKLAVETSKMLLTIAVGVLVASFAWMQFARKDGVAWFSLTLTPFYVAALLLVVSMLSGFLAISRVYRRADGRLAPNAPAWSTEAIRDLLNSQSRCGMAALFALLVGVVLLGLEPGVQKQAVSVTIPAQTGSPPAGGSLTIEGVWTELRLRTAAQQEIKLPQQTLPVTVTCQ